MAIIQKVNFEGLDTDTDLRFMSPGKVVNGARVESGKYRDALNIRVGSSQESNLGAAEHIKGNTLVSFSLPAGTNKCIGSHEDISGNSIFYFIWNSNDNHGIYKYDSIANSISKIFPADESQPDILGFQEFGHITGTAFFNNQLFWTDGINPQRSINVVNAPSLPVPYIEAAIDFIKIPPAFPIIATASYDASVLVNYMDDKSFQFIYRYVYADFQKSVWSTISKIAVTGFRETPKKNKITLDLTSAGNNAEITDTGGSGGTNRYSSIITHIEVAFRDSHTGAYRLINKFEFPTTSIVFLNDEVYPLLDTADTSKIEDTIPVLSKSLSAVQGRIFLGNNTEGFDVDASAITITRNEDTYTTYSDSDTNRMYFKNDSKYNFGIVFYDRGGRRSGVYLKDELKLNVLNCLGEKYPTMSFNVAGTPPDWATHWQIVRSKNLSKSFFIHGKVANILYCTGYNSSGDPIYIVPESGFGYSNNTTQLNAKEIHINIRNFYNSASFVSPINPSQYGPLVNNISYVWTEGDRINFYTKGRAVSTNPRVNPITRTDVYDTNLQHLLIKEQRGDLLIIDAPTTTDILNYQAWVEIYSPYSDSQVDIFYEVGEVYPIINPHTASRAFGNDAGDSKDITIVEGDIYVFRKYLALSSIAGAFNYSIIESMTPDVSDTSGTWELTIGSPNVILENEMQREKTTQIRFGGVLVPETQINNTSTFSSTDQKVLPIEFGPLRKLQVAANSQSEGTILLSIHENEIASLYIGQVVLKQASSGQLTGNTDDIIGSVNPLGKTVGTINPESVKQKDGKIYGIDILRGIVWRYGQDGLTFISEKGNRNFFFQKSQELLGQSNLKIFGAIDPYHNEYIISMPGSDSTKRTIAWSETINEWTSYYSFIPEYFEKVNTNLVSFKSGALWLHHSNALYNNFYGVQYTSKIRPVCNVESSKEKILLNVGTESKDIWVATEISTPEGQETSLVEGDYQFLANAYSANVLRDINTPNIDSPKEPILHGDVMRSFVFEVELENTKTTISPLYYANFKLIPSERSNK